VPDAATVKRRLPVGAEILERGVHFRVWAPEHRRVRLVLEGRAGPGCGGEWEMTSSGDGYHELLAEEAVAGSLYRFRLGREPRLFPDLASRFQPEGPHGPSEVIDPGAFAWSDAAWTGLRLEGQVIYEMHVGTFTRAGTWEAASRELDELKRAGITVIEMMPVADFPGEFGWGYDGVDLYAPTRIYGRPDDLRRFVDAAHAEGLGVILDVVYNHVGPDGAFFKAFAAPFFTDRHANEWGEALDFDGPSSGPVRDFFAANAAYWIREFHFDGLRLDATQTIHDSSPDHIVARIAREARAAAGGRSIVLVAENEAQEARFARPAAEGGLGLDGLWNDDYHHSALVAMTGHREAYYSDYMGTPQELLSAVKRGYLFQGQPSSWQKKDRGEPAWDTGPASFVVYLENHDQVANSANGLRLSQLTSPGRYRALTALTLLAPSTPLLFQGQEFASSRPFLFFADHEPELAAAVRKGRFEFLAQFPSIGAGGVQERLADPGSRETFERCRLDFGERASHREAYEMTKDLLRLRREDPVFRASQRPGSVDGAVLSSQAFVLRYFAASGHADDRLLLVNLGRDLPCHVMPEPLLAPPAGRRWHVAWSTDAVRYGGPGVPPVFTDGGLRLPGESTVVVLPR
jgi:maltooligosyltrehalose trehalohydrolase